VIHLPTAKGAVPVLLYEAPGATAGVIFAGGAGGGFDSPSQGLYPRLADELQREGITAMRLRYREPARLDESVLDVLAGVGFLSKHGIARIALVGHSFGGAVVVSAAALAESVVTVVTLSTQTHGAEAAATLAPRSILLIHGEEDEVLPAQCSVLVHRNASAPKRLEIIPGAHHKLDEASERVHALVRSWLHAQLAPRP
jgi:dienelactone hydrolase